MSDNKRIHIISGGTVSHIATHLALSAPAYGQTGREIADICERTMPTLDTVLHQTRMANGAKFGLSPETNADVASLVDELVADPSTKIVFMPVALCDFDVSMISLWETQISDAGLIWDEAKQASVSGRIIQQRPGKGSQRLRTRVDGEYRMLLKPAPKIIDTIRKTRKDIFLVGFKTTDGATEQEMYLAGLNLLKEASCNLVLANDAKTKLNMVITPEEARYHVTSDRQAALEGLVEMAKLRSHLTFTRSTVIAGEPVPWDSDLVPAALRKVVDYCIAQGAYKPFRGATVGHFAAKISDDTFLTSQRKTNFNDLHKLGLVKIKTDGPDTVLAYGARPSVGGQSQRIIFSDHPEYDCVVHAHVPLRNQRDNPSYSNGEIPVRSQREVECGSHECGRQTSGGLKKFGNLSAVFLDNHGPNIVFHHSIDPQEVIDFIEKHFDLAGKTGGYVTL